MEEIITTLKLQLSEEVGEGRAGKLTQGCWVPDAARYPFRHLKGSHFVCKSNAMCKAIKILENL